MNLMPKPCLDYCWGENSEDFGRSFDQQQPQWSPSLVPSDLGHQHLLSDYSNITANMVSKDSACPLHACYKESCSHFWQFNEPRNMFSYVAHFGLANTAILNSFTQTEILSFEDCGKDHANMSKAGGVAPMYDLDGQAGHSTIWTPRQCINYLSPTQVSSHDPHKEVPLTTTAIGMPEPMYDYFGNNYGSDLSSEMHEDTEELDALLYSDDDTNCSEEGETESTGHCPITFTVSKKEMLEGSMDQGCRSAGPSKNWKRKLFDGGHYDPTLVTDTASSTSLDRHHYAVVSTSPNGKVCWGEVCPDPKKRMRRDAIREAVSVLQNMVPGSKGKSVVMILDEAIQHLESLKAEAHSLGFTSSHF